MDVISSSGAFLLPFLALALPSVPPTPPAQPPALSTLPVEPPPTLPLDPPPTPPMTPREPGGGDSGLMSEANSKTVGVTVGFAGALVLLFLLLCITTFRLLLRIAAAHDTSPWTLLGLWAERSAVVRAGVRTARAGH